MAGVIIKKPRSYPVFGGSLPSTRGGRRSMVLAGVDQDGNWDIQKEDVGPEYGYDEPILYVPFGAIDVPLNMEDLKEMLAGMRESHKRWRDKQPVTPDLTKLTKEWAEKLVDVYSGRKRFFIKGEVNGN